MSDFCGSFGINTKFGFAPSNADVDGAYVAATRREEILTETLVYSDSVVGGRGITGWVDPASLKLRNGQRLVSGGLIMEIGPNQVTPWANAIVGNTAAPISNVWTMKPKWDAIPHDLSFERDLIDHGYRHCVLQSAVFRGRSDPNNQQGQIVQMALSFLGVEQEDIVFPDALALPTATEYPWLVGDSRFLYEDETLTLESFDLTIDNQIKPLFRNRLTPGCFRSLGRKIELDIATPFNGTSETALLHDNTEDKAATLSFVSNNLPAAFSDNSTIFTFPQTRRIAHRHTTSSKDEILLQVKLQAFIKGTSPAMTLTNVIDTGV